MSEKTNRLWEVAKPGGIGQPEEAAAWFAAVVSSSTDAIVGYSCDGLVMSVNPAAERLFGYQAEEIIGQPIRVLIPEDRREEEYRIIERVVSEEHVDHYETVSLHKSGCPIEVSISVSPVRDVGRRIIGAVKIVRDIGERKKAEAKLRDISAELSRTLDTAATGLSRCSLDLRYLSVNAAYAKWLGLPREQIAGRLIVEVIGQAALDVIRPHVEKVLQGERVEYEAELPIEGSLKPIHVVYTPDRDTANNVVGWVASVTDISGLRAMQRIAESEERVSAIVRTAVDAIIVIDATGLIQSVNPATERLFGYTSSELVGKNISTLMPEPDRSRHDAYIAAYLRTGERKIIGIGREVQARRKDGSLFPVDLAVAEWQAGGERFFTGIVRDITERRQHEEQLRRLATFNEAALKSLGEGVYTLDGHGLLTFINPAAEELFGWTFAELRGKKMHDVVHHHHRDGRPYPASECAVLQVLTHGRPLKDHEDVFIRKDGTFFDVMHTITPLHDGSGKMTGLIVAFSDISERKRREEKIQLLLREVNHRSKNMLSVVQAIARQTVAANPNHFVERFAERVQALATSQDLLVQSEWKGVDLRELARSQLALFKDLIGQRIELQGPALSISAPAAQIIGMALHELATNAGKYGALSNERGRVKIAWDLERANGQEAAFAMSWSEENGPPVTAPIGTGFGSTLIAETVETSLDAKVELNFAAAGLTWQLRCPAVEVVDEVQPRLAAKSTPPLAIATRTAAVPRILLVEDEPLVALEIAHMLKQGGFETVGPARTVSQALDLLKSKGCDAALLDINLGKETSELVALELSRLNTPFISVSGYSRAQQPPVFNGAPALAKPLRPELLIAEIKRCINIQASAGRLSG
jgi:PAS domain S-box-containing protein